MIQEKFKEAAKELNCQYEYSEQFIKSFGGSNIPISYHRFTLEYKTVVIKVIYEFGNTSLGEIKSVIETRKILPSITVSTKSHISRLFSRKKHPFIIKCKEPLLKSFILDSLDTSGYNKIAKKTTFEPEITANNQDQQYIIYTRFFLGFDKKEDSLIPSINLHKMIIDKIVR